MKSYFIIIVIVLTMQLSACEPDVLEIGIKREWSFDSITYENTDIMYCVNLNLFKFKDYKDVELPSIFYDCEVFPKSENDMGTWQIIEKQKNKVFLKINSENIAFNDMYRLTFHKEKTTGRLLAVLKSEKMRIRMRCALIPNGNESFIDKLISRTN